MSGVFAVSAAPIAVAFVVGVGGFIALLPLLMHEAPEPRAPELLPRAVAAVSDRETEARTAPPLRRASRLRLVVTIGALVVWSVWSVRRPRHPGRHD